jgi:hypothetical protein
VCKGNYNLGTIEQQLTQKDIFCNRSHKLIYLKDKGDSSDLTGVHKDEQKVFIDMVNNKVNKVKIVLESKESGIKAGIVKKK